MTCSFSKRASGLLLHITSLPSPFGIGDLGQEARDFIDFLASSGQTLWQVLPLVPTGYGNSPYQSLSAFAGNTLLIDPRQLADERSIAAHVVVEPNASDTADFAAAAELKSGGLSLVFEQYAENSSDDLAREFQQFCEMNSWWLDDYALYRALRQAHGDRAWTDWDAALSFREETALNNARVHWRDQIQRERFG